jgi:hypothetical protein
MENPNFSSHVCCCVSPLDFIFSSDLSDAVLDSEIFVCLLLGFDFVSCSPSDFCSREELAFGTGFTVPRFFWFLISLLLIWFVFSRSVQQLTRPREQEHASLASPVGAGCPLGLVPHSGVLSVKCL